MASLLGVGGPDPGRPRDSSGINGGSLRSPPVQSATWAATLRARWARDDVAAAAALRSRGTGQTGLGGASAAAAVAPCGCASYRTSARRD